MRSILDSVVPIDVVTTEVLKIATCISKGVQNIHDDRNNSSSSEVTC